MKAYEGGLRARKDEEEMHERAVMREAFTDILVSLEKTPGVQVTHVHLAMGVSRHFSEEEARQYFQMLAQSTPVEGAELELEWLPATYQCLSCSRLFESTSPRGTCRFCGDLGREVAHQDKCEVCCVDIAYTV